MAKIFSSAEQLVGSTPLIRLKKIEKAFSSKAQIIAKLESFNIAGSSKDRVALSMLNEAERQGKLKEGSVIIEPTSGNTGIGLAMVSAARGYRLIIVMPENMSEERKKLIAAFGAELILTDASKGMAGAIEKAEELEKEIEGSMIAGQFYNPANPKAHFETTGPEIWQDTDGEVDIFVAGVGTGGTISGVGEFLKSKNKDIKIIAVEPESSPFLSKGIKGPHKIQGIGAGFVPKTLNTEIYDEIITVSDEEAMGMGREIARKEGILVGISSGATLFAATKIAKFEENKDKKIVVLLPDTGDRYLSTEMF